MYCDPPSHYSLTGVIHAPRLADRFATNFFSTRQFFADAESGQLPTYSFIEPQIIGWNHNDMHPPFGGVLSAVAAQKGADASDLHFDPPSSLIGGEDLLARIYNAIRSSSSDTGSNHLNTTLLVTFDEHGGTYDHVPPPPAVPPDGKGAPGQMGFTFNRSGVRIPTLAISAWIPERTVVNDEHRATSLLATMRERWNLGKPFTAREASARSFSDIFTLASPRPQEDWPEITPARSPRCPSRSRPSTPRSACSASRCCSAFSRWPSARKDRPRPQARRHDHRRTGDRDRPRVDRRGLPRDARRLAGFLEECPEGRCAGTRQAHAGDAMPRQHAGSGGKLQEGLVGPLREQVHLVDDLTLRCGNLRSVKTGRSWIAEPGSDASRYVVHRNGEGISRPRAATDLRQSLAACGDSGTGSSKETSPSRSSYGVEFAAKDAGCDRRSLPYDPVACVLFR